MISLGRRLSYELTDWWHFCKKPPTPVLLFVVVASILAFAATSDARRAHHRPHRVHYHHHVVAQQHQHHYKYGTSGHGDSMAGLPPPLVAIVNVIEETCKGFRAISTFRPGAKVAGTNRTSQHALHKAVDIDGGDYSCAYGVLRGFPGGVSTDANVVHHIHISYNPDSIEWGARFTHHHVGHGHGHRRSHRRNK